MPSAFADGGRSGSCLLATCWAHQKPGAPTLPVWIGNKDTEARLDTGSVVTLLRPDLEGGWRGEPIEVACVHGDTRTYETCHVVVRTPRGVYVTWAGIVPHLPVPLLIGRDCPIFHRLWNPVPGSRPLQDQPRQPGRTGRPAYGARLAPSTQADLSAGDGGTEGDGPTPPGTPAHSTGGPHRAESAGRPLDTPDTLTRADRPTGRIRELPSHRVFGFFPDQFATAQLQDDVLKHGWSHVLAHEGQARELVSCLPHPHFSTKGGLLYRVVEKGGKVTEQLVVPRPNVSKVLFMARSHL